MAFRLQTMRVKWATIHTPELTFVLSFLFQCSWKTNDSFQFSQSEVMLEGLTFTDQFKSWRDQSLVIRCMKRNPDRIHHSFLSCTLWRKRISRRKLGMEIIGKDTQRAEKSGHLLTVRIYKAESNKTVV